MYNPNYNEQGPGHGKSNTGLIVTVSLLSVILVFALIFILLFSTGIISFNSFNAKPTETAAATATPAPPAPPTAPPQVIVVQHPEAPPVNNYYNTIRNRPLPLIPMLLKTLLKALLFHLLTASIQGILHILMYISQVLLLTRNSKAINKSVNP